jgi:hypothetical protein
LHLPTSPPRPLSRRPENCSEGRTNPSVRRTSALCRGPRTPRNESPVPGAPAQKRGGDLAFAGSQRVHPPRPAQRSGGRARVVQEAAAARSAGRPQHGRAHPGSASGRRVRERNAVIRPLAVLVPHPVGRGLRARR